MGGIWRLIAPLSFAVSSAPIALWQILRHRPDVVLCIEPTLMVAPVAVSGAADCARTVLHVQDLESTRASRLATQPFRRLEALATALNGCCCAASTACSRFRGMPSGSSPRALPSSASRSCAIGSDLDHIKPLESVSPYRGELGMSGSDRIVLYSGTSAPSRVSTT